MSASDVEGAHRVGPLRRRVMAFLLVILLPILGFIQFGNVHFFKVPSASMEPTLNPSDYIVARSMSDYVHGDIVVFEDPDFAKEYLVKRIVGMGGDTISVVGGAVYLNGSYASEPYRYRPIDYQMAPFQVPEGHLFVLGDNADRSIDSHNWGASEAGEHAEHRGEPRSIPEDHIIGKVQYIYLPMSRAGRLESYPLRTIGVP